MDTQFNQVYIISPNILETLLTQNQIPSPPITPSTPNTILSSQYQPHQATNNTNYVSSGVTYQQFPSQDPSPPPNPLPPNPPPPNPPPPSNDPPSDYNSDSEIEEGERFVCRICNRSYASVGHLRRHKRSHRPPTLACPIEGCEYRFSRTDNMRSHHRNHVKAIDEGRTIPPFRQTRRNNPPIVIETKPTRKKSKASTSSSSRQVTSPTNQIPPLGLLPQTNGQGYPIFVLPIPLEQYAGLFMPGPFPTDQMGIPMQPLLQAPPPLPLLQPLLQTDAIQLPQPTPEELNATLRHLEDLSRQQQ